MSDIPYIGDILLFRNKADRFVEFKKALMFEGFLF